MNFKALDCQDLTNLNIETENSKKHYKSINIFFKTPMKVRDRFKLNFRFKWLHTMDIEDKDSKDTDHWYIGNIKNINIKLNFPLRLRHAKFFLIKNRSIKEELNADLKNMPDGSFTYSCHYENNFKFEGLIFYYDGALLNTIKKTKNTVIRKTIENDIYYIEPCKVEYLNEVHKLEYQIEKKHAAKKKTLKERLLTFNDGFLVVKNKSNKIIGYVQSLIWNDIYFERFEEINDFPLLFDPEGDVLYVIFIAVATRYRRRGIASIMLQELEKIGLRYNVRKIVLVSKDEITELYINNGFDIKEMKPNFLGDRSYISVLMNKNIKSE